MSSSPKDIKTFNLLKFSEESEKQKTGKDGKSKNKNSNKGKSQKNEGIKAGQIK